MSNLHVRKVPPGQALTLPDALSAAATFTSLDAWSQLVKEMYGYETYRFEAIQADEVPGILAITHVRHPIFGNYLATSPFGSFGGFAFSSMEARDALLHETQRLANELKTEYALIRFIEGSNVAPSPWLQNPIYSTYFIDLPPNPDDLMKDFSHQHRKHTRQSLRKGFKVQFGHLELLDEAYEVLARSMHELGSPYHSKKYLQRMAVLFGDKLEFVVLKDAMDTLAGSAVLIHHGSRMATNLHANILRSHRSDYAGECLYWNILEHYCEKGVQVCDMGRSLIGSGNEIFKMKWKPRKELLAYWFALMPGHGLPELNQKNPRFRFAIWLWKRMPAFIVRPLGPSLIKGLA
jgi:FemAB-related protein (PEP-CTERM system-associated)